MATTIKLGNNYEISLQEVFANNREKLLNQLDEGSLVFLKGGAAETRFDSDHEPLFRQESYFLWLTGVVDPDCAVAISKSGCTLFIPRLPPSYATIMGHIKTPDEWKELFQVDQVLYTDTTETFLLEQLETLSNGQQAKVLLMDGENSDSGNRYEPPKFSDERLQSLVDSSTLFPIMAECRVIKSPAELDLLRHVSEVTSFAHVYVMRNIRPEMFEYQCESLFRHYCYYNYGCRLVAYTPICGCGPDGAVLHYGHTGEPNARQIAAEDMCLYDMGAEYFGYGSDVTCSFPASGTFTEKQKGIWEGVVQAQISVYNMFKPGVSFVDCHKAAEKTILEHLAGVGIVKPGDTSFDELVEKRLGAVFMPHGLGHFIGIDTHDVGGYLPGHPTRIQQPGLKSLRTARILAANMVMTVEPGCYFIDHLLDEALAGDLGVYLDGELLQEYRGFGGCRLEDVVAVTDTGFVNYTLCPRTVKEIEYVMAGGKWPPMQDEAPELGRARLLDPTPLPPPPSL